MSQVPTLLLKRSDDDSQEEVFEVSNQILVGRSRKCDILLDDCLVSRSHALFQFKNSTLFLKPFPKISHQELSFQDGVP